MIFTRFFCEFITFSTLTFQLFYLLLRKLFVLIYVCKKE